MSRFALVKEPTGKWTVFDDVAGIPAHHEGRELSGLTKADAEFALLQCAHPSYVSKLLPFPARPLAADAAAPATTYEPNEDVP